MTYIITCGGTAGHVNPGISIADELQRRLLDCKIIFIGADRELEKRLIPSAGYELINIKMSGIRRGFKPSDIIYNIKTLRNIITARRTARKILRDIKPDAVIGTGGYICYPVIKEAAKQKIPTFLHESNALPGMTVRKLSAVANKVMVTYTGFERYYKHPERIIITGTPVRKELLAANTEKRNELPLVISFWGSLGASGLNKKMVRFIKENAAEKMFRHIHATGNGDATKALIEELLNEGIAIEDIDYIEIRDYIVDLPGVLAAADIVLCRAGGITLAEIAAAGKASILIPSPYVPDNVQQINAEQLHNRGAAKIHNEFECDGEILYNEVVMLLKDIDKLSKMAQEAKMLAKPNAAEDIVDVILGNRE